jgi:hypothetical protein
MGRIAMRTTLGLLAFLTLTGAGCSTAREVRYVYQDGDFGVVGMPENTDRRPTHYRRQAERLMDSHFPEGHEIVRAEEVEEGSRTVKVEGSATAEVAPSLTGLMLTAVKLGRTASRSRSDTVKVKECRIIYRRAGSQGPPPDFSEVASLAPSQYVDPNASVRHQAAKPADGEPKCRAEDAKEGGD